jgi:hypothetical protein
MHTLALRRHAAARVAAGGTKQAATVLQRRGGRYILLWKNNRFIHTSLITHGQSQRTVTSPSRSRHVARLPAAAVRVAVHGLRPACCPWSVTRRPAQRPGEGRGARQQAAEPREHKRKRRRPAAARPLPRPSPQLAQQVAKLRAGPEHQDTPGPAGILPPPTTTHTHTQTYTHTHPLGLSPSPPPCPAPQQQRPARPQGPHQLFMKMS